MIYDKKELVHGVYVTCLVEKLLRQIEYAKTNALPNRALYEVHGRITMAHELKAISVDEYLMLSHECVANGINNPKYFDQD